MCWRPCVCVHVQIKVEELELKDKVSVSEIAAFIIQRRRLLSRARPTSGLRFCRKCEHNVNTSGKTVAFIEHLLHTSILNVWAVYVDVSLSYTAQKNPLKKHF